MEISKHDTDGPAVNRGIDAATISFSEEPALAASGGSHRFALRVTCTGVVARGSATTFPVDDLSALQSDTACRGALRGMLEQLPQLRSLWLAEDEWDAVVPADIVPQIVRVARGDDAKDGFTFCFAMKVHRRIIFIYGEQALLMACKERELDLRAAKTEWPGGRARRGTANLRARVPPPVHFHVVLQGDDVPHVPGQR
ncbi:hypothetical protein ZWY2020_010346 [Hordeum vulgare]|nr:hypothetical protein ZWY2020_010346 [Hordeum vulgare]